MNLLAYRPHPLLRSGHLQTISVGLFCGHRPAYHARPLIVPLDQEESLVVHEELGAPLPTDADMAILMHGLGGDHRSAYLERLAPRLRNAGFVVWRMDLRGCGHGLNHAWRPANAGRSEDLAAVVLAAKRQHPNRNIHLVGFSLSGNILLKMLGEAGHGLSSLNLQENPISSALAIAPPADLHNCCDNMDRNSRKVYTTFYLRMLEQQVQQRRQRWKRWDKIPKQPLVKTIRQFDARYTAPLSGYSNVNDYYSDASALPVLTGIQTPTIILADRHDPIVPFKAIAGVERSTTTEFVETQLGGHMGYFGLDENGKLIRWLEHYVVHHLKTRRQLARA